MSNLDTDEIQRHAREFTSEITKLVTSRERSKESTCGLIMALANLLVMVVYIVMPEKNKAMELVVAAISKAFRMAEENRVAERAKEAGEAVEIIVYEISADPQTPGK